MFVHLNNDRTFIVPLDKFPAIQALSPQQKEDFEIIDGDQLNRKKLKRMFHPARRESWAYNQNSDGTSVQPSNQNLKANPHQRLVCRIGRRIPSIVAPIPMDTGFDWGDPSLLKGSILLRSTLKYFFLNHQSTRCPLRIQASIEEILQPEVWPKAMALASPLSIDLKDQISSRFQAHWHLTPSELCSTCSTAWCQTFFGCRF